MKKQKFKVKVIDQADTLMIAHDVIDIIDHKHSDGFYLLFETGAKSYFPHNRFSYEIQE